MDNDILKIPFIPNSTNLEDFPENAVKVSIDSHNWKDRYPYKPEVYAYLWHTGNDLFIRYEVEEDHIAALADTDNGKVYKDSCMEFFVTFSQPGYYNIEANCIGNILMSHRLARKEEVKYLSDSLLSKIERLPSLGRKPFSCRKADGKWILTLKVPASSFFKEEISSFNGREAMGNFYKCGDALPSPHFLSWKPITTENPDFHRPEFFGRILFE